MNNSVLRINLPICPKIGTLANSENLFSLQSLYLATCYNVILGITVIGLGFQIEIFL